MLLFSPIGAPFFATANHFEGYLNFANLDRIGQSY